MSNKHHPDQWSTVTIHFTDGQMTTMNIDAGPSIARYLADQLSKDGFCMLRNGREAVIVRADNVKTIHMQLLTHGEHHEPRTD